MSYKVEELLALRDSVSESAVSIDKFADEDVIKEHVLRPSASATLISTAPSEKPLAPPAVLAATSNPKKPSPSPSVKRGKAERLLKEHGSPPGLRVTAGGRIVPSDLPPLSTARNNNTFRPQAFRPVGPGNHMAIQTQPGVNHNNGLPQVEVIGTQAVIRVGDKVYALPAIEQGVGYPLPPVSAPALENANKQHAAPSSIPVSGAFTSSGTQSSFLGLDLPTLESQWSAKKEELRFVEQTEVLQADQQGPTWRNTMIAKKKSLILEIDALRKQIAVAKEAGAGKDEVPTVQPTSLPSSAAIAPPSAFVPFQQQVNPAMYSNIGLPFGIPTSTPFSPLMMYQPYAAATSGYVPDAPQFGHENHLFVPGDSSGNGVQLPKTNTGANGPHSPGSASRRSHAVPIKKPQEEPKKQAVQISTLDPKSPTYEPVGKANGKSENMKDFVPPTPSPPKRSSWRSTEVGSAQSNKHEERAISQKPSLSSIDTTDFFPTNTHEHSSTRMAPNRLSKQSSRENTADPTTPDKHWPIGPWNPPSGGPASGGSLAVQNEPTRRLTSWPEAFGKQSSLPTSSNKTMAESAASSLAQRKSSSTQPTGADLYWASVASKPINHVPFTYQEGYQAGLQVVGVAGLPDNAEVLNGFVDGVVAYLRDKSIKDRKANNPTSGILSGRYEYNDTSSARSSLRGYLSGVTLNNSAANLAENVRSAKANPMSTAGYRQSTYGPVRDVPDVAMMYSRSNDSARETHQHGHPLELYQESHQRRSPVSMNVSKDDQGRFNLAQSESAFTRQFAENQLGNRSYGTPISMQRYFPAAKEYLPRSSNADVTPFTRPVARQRCSGLDGAVDDLAGLVMNVQVDEQVTAHPSEAEASCFKSSSGKGKSKVPSSPTKSASGNGKETSSPAKASGSPKKSGEHSPAKAKLEQVTNKLRRPKKDDPRTMSPEEKQERTEKWRKRFRGIKNREMDEIRAYVRDNPRREG